MKNLKYSDGLFSIEGAVSIEDNLEFTAAWRIDCRQKEFYPYLNQPHMGGAGAGVRIEFISDTSAIGIYINEVHSSDAGFHDVMTLDLVCDGKYIETLYVSGEPGEYHVVTGTFPVDDVRAFYNWDMVFEDRSEGVHNVAYTMALIKNSIEAMK